MNHWDERIRAHSVWTEMRDLGPAIDSALAVEGADLDVSFGLERLKAILAYLGKRIAAADPLITAMPPLDGVAAALISIRNELIGFVSDKSANHIATANFNADNALIIVSQIPVAYSPEELGELVARTTHYRDVVFGALQEAQEKLYIFRAKSDGELAALESKLNESAATSNARLEALQGNLTVLSASLEAERQKLSVILSEQQGQFSTAQETRTKDFTEGLRLATEGYTKLVTDYQNQFSVAQDARQTKYNETVAEFTKRLGEQDSDFAKQRIAFVSEATQSLKKLTSDYGDQADIVLKDIKIKQKHVEDLVGVIGNLGVTSGYLKTANQARQAMWFWQAATLASLITLIAFAKNTLGALETHGGEFNWGGFAARALLLVSLGVLAAYSGSQADKLFGDDRRNRKLALELEAIGPYLAPLPIEDQNKFRFQIGERSFGRDHDEHKKSPASILDLVKPKDSKEILKLIVELLGKAKDLKD